MGLLNFVGMTAAGAGKGYGDAKAAVGGLTLQSLIKEAEMDKADNLARFRQQENNAFTAGENEKTRTAQADRDVAATSEYSTSPEWGKNPETGQADQFVLNKKGEKKWLGAGDDDIYAKIKGGKGTATKPEKMPDHIFELFKTSDQYDEMGNKIGAGGVDQDRLGQFIIFKSSVGRDMTYEDAAAQFLAKNQPAAPSNKPTLEELFGAPPDEAPPGTQKAKEPNVDPNFPPFTLNELREKTREKGLLGMGAEKIGNHFKRATQDPRFPGLW